MRHRKLPCVDCITLPICKQQIYQAEKKDPNITSLVQKCSLINEIVFSRVEVKGDPPVEWMTYETVTINKEILERITNYICHGVDPVENEET